MTDDLIKRVEAWLTNEWEHPHTDTHICYMVSELLAALKDRDEALATVRAALKAARAENERLRGTNRDAVAFSETCCGKCTGPCYVDQMTGA
jgi:hypothetical protein